jgi:hypothetical protein
VGSALNSIAYGQAMVAAVRDYVKETEQEQAAAAAAGAPQRFDVDELLDDPELQALHEERLAKLKAEAERRAELERRGHGRYEEVGEADFLEAVTRSDRVVAHFFHRDFERCKIVDAHLPPLAKRFPDTRFIKVSAPDAPFFTVKLGIKVLPAVVFFRDGVAVGRVVGFDALGGRDDFSTSELERSMRACGVVADRRRVGEEGGDPEDEDDEDGGGQGARRRAGALVAAARTGRPAAGAKMGGSGAVRVGGGRLGASRRGGGDEDDDESSDFD